jgi:hypothetical protein
MGAPSAEQLVREQLTSEPLPQKHSRSAQASAASDSCSILIHTVPSRLRRMDQPHNVIMMHSVLPQSCNDL